MTDLDMAVQMSCDISLTTTNTSEVRNASKVRWGNLERGVTWNEIFLLLLTPVQALLGKDT